MAHDVLSSIILGEVPFPLDPYDQPLVIAAMDVLCWVLEHEHNQKFEDNLRVMASRLAAQGYVLREKQNSDP